MMLRGANWTIPWSTENELHLERRCGCDRDTLKLVCLHCVQDVRIGTSMILKREPENVRRLLRNFKHGQHENTSGTHEGVVTTDTHDFWTCLV